MGRNGSGDAITVDHKDEEKERDGESDGEEIGDEKFSKGGAFAGFPMREF